MDNISGVAQDNTPVQAVTATKLNLACGKLLRPKEEGWLNADIQQLEGVDIAFNCFVVPWPFEDNQFEHIYAGHIVEHIPHVIREVQNGRPEPIWDMDGFFVWFREVYRILKPGGTIELVGPYHRSSGADQDPTHTRYITEATFSYLWQESPTFDYRLGYKFEQTEWGLSFSHPDMATLQAVNPTEWQKAAMFYWNAFSNFRTVLKKV